MLVEMNAAFLGPLYQQDRGDQGNWNTSGQHRRQAHAICTWGRAHRASAAGRAWPPGAGAAVPAASGCPERRLRFLTASWGQGWRASNQQEKKETVTNYRGNQRKLNDRTRDWSSRRNSAERVGRGCPLNPDFFTR